MPDRERTDLPHHTLEYQKADIRTALGFWTQIIVPDRSLDRFIGTDTDTTNF